RSRVSRTSRWCGAPTAPRARRSTSGRTSGSSRRPSRSARPPSRSRSPRRTARPAPTTTPSTSSPRHECEERPMSIKPLISVAAALGAGLLLAAHAAAAPTPLAAPSVPGVPGLPGPAAPAAQPAANMGLLTTKPDSGVAGTTFTISGAGLPAGKDVLLTWSTANVTWIVDARPDSVDYLGRQTSKFAIVIAHGTTNAAGAFSTTVKAPQDWGGIHDLYAVVDGVQYAKGGFLSARSASITPKKGPIGTPITVTYTGLGSSLY